MHTETHLYRFNHGNDFRAYTLRGESVSSLDPFLAVDHAWMNEATFPPHPHAGFSAVSYLFLDSETGITNRDSLGNRNIIQPGGLHWTAAGRGVVHEEIPTEQGKTVHMLQIFVNLSKEMQQQPAKALSLLPHDIPVIQDDGRRIRVVLGEFEGVSSPLCPPTEVNMYDISLDDEQEQEITIPAGHNAFILPVFGSLEVDNRSYASDIPKVPVFSCSMDKQKFVLVAKNGNCKLVVFTGKPLHQPVYWQGPFALSSKTELGAAIAAYQHGKFGTLV
jgi:redox-sensitive bicupin YhaK (pirin superfamily)